MKKEGMVRVVVSPLDPQMRGLGFNSRKRSNYLVIKLKIRIVVYTKSI